MEINLKAYLWIKILYLYYILCNFVYFILKQQSLYSITVFQALQVPYWNIRKFLILWLKSTVFSEWIFLFFKLGSSLLKFFILRARKFYSLKYKSSIFSKCKNSFLLRKYKKVPFSEVWEVFQALFSEI